MDKILCTDFEGELDPAINLDGDYIVDHNNALVGDSSLRMATNPNNAPYYFSYWHALPLMSGLVRLEVTAAINNNVRSFGIGWRVNKGGLLYIMFVRVNYDNDRIELVQGTPLPHLFLPVATPIPIALRSNNPLRPFRLSLDVDVDTMTYQRVRLHDFTSRNAINDFVWPINIVNNPLKDPYTPDGMTIKINPQGSAGLSGATWMDEVTVFN
jgi:hypothetical protein